MNDLKKEFPYFASNPDIVYLDSAATTQKPRSVIDAVARHLSASANAGRGSYAPATKLRSLIEDIRGSVAHFLNANGSHEVVFTSGATERLNLVALSWGMHNLKDGDEIIYCPEDHASTVLPWVRLRDALAERGISIKLVPFAMSKACDVNAAEVVALVTDRTRLIVLTHVHNVYGDKVNVANIRKSISRNVLISLDVSQSAGHIPLDVRAWGVDFVSFSGHKMFAPEGIGVLWVCEDLHKKLTPVKVGGGSGSMRELYETDVALDVQPMPYLLEAGTVNATGVIGIGAAIAFINKIGIENIARHSHALTRMLIERLKKTDRVEVLPGIATSCCLGGFGIVSFRIEGVSSQEAGFVLDQHGVLVRTGSHCAATGEKQHNAIRASLHIYNTEEDISRLIDALESFI